MNSPAYRYSWPLLVLTLSGNASAMGLGELTGHPVLGDRVHLEVPLLGAEKLYLDASCFRLIPPAGDGDLPWLKKASFSVRQGKQPVLEIRSEVPLREPILQVAVKVGCGHEVSREYVLMASPALADVVPETVTPTLSTGPAPAKHVRRDSVRIRSVLPPIDNPPHRLEPRKSSRRQLSRALPDRLVLMGETEIGEPSLRLATEMLLGADGGAQEAQREILRLEYRMLMALNEQATSQLATAEKLRNMEGTLGELQQRADLIAQRVDKNGPGAGAAAVPDTAAGLAAGTLPDLSSRTGVPARSHEADDSGMWGLYGALLGSALGLAGWLLWRNRRIQQADIKDIEHRIVVPDVEVDPQRSDERAELGGVDLPFEPAAMGMPMHLDLELDTKADVDQGVGGNKENTPQRTFDSVMSINATTLDEHFEANPVMELADIMLSFGRVKGAAQALQEYIDHNPQEALQPWIRLMDVYRMAGMRTEFESVARNLNQNFNVEVQSWDGGSKWVASDGEGANLQAARPQSLEDMPRLMKAVLDLWRDGDVVGYLYQLLRDNRGGQRQGFALPVVEDILFLIELKETANRMDAH